MNRPVILLSSLALLGAGCAPLSPVAQPAPAEVSALQGLSHFSDAALGIAFDYPSAWGEPEIMEEPGTSEAGSCIYQRAVTFPSLQQGGMIVLTAVSSTTSDTPCDTFGRGGYWGDLAHGVWNQTESPQGETAFRPRSDGESGWFGGSDQVRYDEFFTASGEPVFQATVPQYDVPFETETLSDVHFYLLFHAKHPLASVMISDERMKQYGFMDQDEEVRTLVESITFVDDVH